jgi:hypothetical protein
MKKITAAIAILAIIFLTFPAIKRAFTGKSSSEEQPSGPTAYLEMGSIIVKGPGNTLASIATQVGRPEVFSYDRNRKTAVCRGNIMVEGELAIGDPKGQGLTETLEFSTRVCGDCMLLIPPEGSLKIYNAELSTVERSSVGGVCPQGYGIMGKGEVIMHNVRLSYMSGSSSTLFLGREARGILDRVISYGGETNAMSCARVKGDNVRIKNCNFLAAGNWGACLGPTYDSPMVIERTVFTGKSGDILVQAQADLVLVDCQFRGDKISFAEQVSSVTVRWTRWFRLLDARTDQPVAGATVTASSSADAAAPETCTTTTDADGFCSVVLTEYKAAPGRVTRVDGVNNSAPYHVTFRAPDGRTCTVIADPHVATAKDEYTLVKITGHEKDLTADAAEPAALPEGAR